MGKPIFLLELTLNFFLEGQARGGCAVPGKGSEDVDATRLRGLEGSYAAVHVGKSLRSDPETMAGHVMIIVKSCDSR